MKKYTYTILLIVTCLIAIPFLGPKILGLAKDDAKQVVSYFRPADDVAVSVQLPSDGSADATEVTENTANASDASADAKGKRKKKTKKKTKFHKVDRSYFDDALFIGDSRTIGLSEYADLGTADVFADSGLSVYKAMADKISVDGVGNTTLENLLQKKTYGKVYIMLGINELGYDFDQTVAKYQSLVDLVHTSQPDAVIFLEANLHVTKEKSDKEDLFNNEHIDRFNKSVRKLADGKTSYYIDINEKFDGDDGALNADLTNDGAHVLGVYYSEWADWILTKGI
jgi:lysophospholipase L1-like esterase